MTFRQRIQWWLWQIHNISKEVEVQHFPFVWERQEMINNYVRERGYDEIYSMCTVLFRIASYGTGDMFNFYWRYCLNGLEVEEFIPTEKYGQAQGLYDRLIDFLCEYITEFGSVLDN
jgi:hypothetical protein